MEQILTNLLVPDSDVIKRATEDLKAAFKLDDAIPQLCTVMASSSVVMNRQYAALLLRKKLGRESVWKTINQDTRNHIKSGCLTALVAEPEKNVAQAISRLVAALAKHSNEQWPDLFQFLSSNAPRAAHTMSALAEVSGDSIMPNLRHFINIFRAALQNGPADPETAFYTVVTLTHLVAHIGNEEAKLFGPLVPLVVAVIRHLVTVDEDKAGEAMDIFDELFESEVPLVAPYVEQVLELCLTVAADENLGDSVRAKAIAGLGRVTKVKRKAVANKKMLVPMIQVLFKVVCEMPHGEDGDDEEEEIFGSVESNTPSVVAAQTLDTMSIHLPPEKFMPVLLSHVQPALASQDPVKLRGAFYSLAVVAEGCSENIKRKYLMDFLKCIDAGITHPAPAVRNSALYALGQFSEYLQPDISNYADTILPVLLSYLDMSLREIEGKTEAHDSPSLDRIFYALEIYTENLEEKLIPLLPEVMNRLLAIVSGVFPVRAKELAVSCIGSVASGIEDGIIPYFDAIMAPLKGFLVFEEGNLDSAIMFNQCLDTLASLARAVGPVGFAPKLAEECCSLALGLIEKHDDPDVRRCAYNLFSAVSLIVKEEMSTVLAQIIPLLLLSVKSKEGISLQYKDESESGLNLDELSDEEEENDDEISLASNLSAEAADNVKAISVENAFMEEKEGALIALKEICLNSGPAFSAYLQETTTEVLILTDFPDGDVRRAAIAALSQFAICFYKSGDFAKFEELTRALFPVIVRNVKEEEDASVVCSCLESVVELLKGCTNGITNIQGMTDLIVQCITDVMKANCACMNKDDEDDEEEEGQEAEQDELIFEYAGDVIPSLGRAMDPATFSTYFVRLAPMLLKKCGKNCTPAEKSFGVGSTAECLESLTGYLNPHVESLLNMFMNLSRDEDEDVRNNAVFGAGELALHGGQAVVPHYRKIMTTLSKMLQSGEKDPRVLDQIVGCLCRLLLANKASVPLDNVLPVIFEHLPLREDQGENEIVFRAVQVLYTDGNPVVKTNLAKIVLSGVRALAEKKPEEKAVNVIVPTLRQFSIDFNSEFAAAVGQLDAVQQQKLAAALA